MNKYDPDNLITILESLADLEADNKIGTPGEYHPDYHTVWAKVFFNLVVEHCAQLVETEKVPWPASNSANMLRTNKYVI